MKMESAFIEARSKRAFSIKKMGSDIEKERRKRKRRKKHILSKLRIFRAEKEVKKEPSSGSDDSLLQLKLSSVILKKEAN
jgi:hypothetical protein